MKYQKPHNLEELTKLNFKFVKKSKELIGCYIYKKENHLIVYNKYTDKVILDYIKYGS